MKMNFKTLAAFCALSLGLTSVTGCNSDEPQSIDESQSGFLSNTTISKTDTEDIAGYDASVKAVAAPVSSDCTIKFSESAVEVNGGNVETKDTAVTITRPGVYTVSGSCKNGKMIIDAGKGNEVTLILNGIDLKSADNSAIECKSGKLITLYIAEGTENIISDTANYIFANGEDEPDGAIYSKSDMVIAGNGKLTVNGLYKDGVKCKDTLSINCGELVINAADDGITGKDCVVVQDGKFAINAGGDGIKSTNSEDSTLGYVTINGGEFDISSESDGIQAETSLSIKGGTFKLVCGGDAADAEIAASSGGMFDRDKNFGWRNNSASGSSNGESGSSQKGLKAGAEIIIDSGEFNIKAADDAIHGNGSVTVNGGVLKLSSCDDGIHADEILDISSGEINIVKSYEGLEGKNINISGGTISVKAADDGVNAAGGDNGSMFGFSGGDYFINITGGDITVNADGDGIDSNGTITQSGGKITVYGPEGSGNGAIDYEKSYTLSGGTLIALGSLGMAQAPGTLSQPCISVSGNADANSTIEVRGGDGKVILSTVTPKKCQSLIFSCEEFKSGSKYGVYVNNSLVSEVTASDGLSGNGAGAGGGFGGHGGFGGGGFGHGGFGQGGNIDPNNSDFTPGGNFDPNNGNFGHGGKIDPNNSDFNPDGNFDPNNSNNFKPGGNRPGRNDFNNSQNGAA